MKYESRNRIIFHKDVLNYEQMGLSDRQIAFSLGLTPMGFSKIRKEMGWKRRFPWKRTDKGVIRKSVEEKRAKKNGYQRKRYEKVETAKFCYFCGKEWKDGINATDEEGVIKYVCADCCVKKGEEADENDKFNSKRWKL